LGKKYKGLEDFTSKSIEELTRSFMEETGITGKELIHPLRVATTGKTVSPPVFEVLEILGKEKVVRRLTVAEV